MEVNRILVNLSQGCEFLGNMVARSCGQDGGSCVSRHGGLGIPREEHVGVNSKNRCLLQASQSLGCGVVCVPRGMAFREQNWYYLE